jgi:hypothetical protein
MITRNYPLDGVREKLYLSFENTGRMGASVDSSRTPPIASFQHGVLEPRFTWMFPKASLRPGCRLSMPA